ncbi:MAG: CotH kinase family protein [Fibrobacter sp.]|nr:CotH kinase family protein [Fibrobacter sp.]
MTVLLASAFLAACSDKLQEVSEVESSSSNGIDSGSFLRTAPVVFTEINPKNTTLEDEDGDRSDWIELFNPADTAVNLSGYSLSNSASKPHLWNFGNVIVPPQSFLIVYFSKKDRPNFEEPSDSTDLLGYGTWSWSDAQNSPVAGESVAEPWQFSGFVSEENGHREISAQIQLVDNAELGWSSACVFLGVESASTSDTHDLGSANQLLLTGYITKDEPLELRLAQPDYDDWLGWSTTLTGTGDPSTTYKISLPTGTTFPDLKNIYGSRFSAVSNHYNRVQFHFTSYIARNQGHFPHTNFKLPQGGGNIFLFDSTGTLRDSIIYPNVPQGQAYSYTALGWGFAKPTPLGIANEAFPTQASNVFNLPESGFYTDPFTISLVSDSASVVRCELGGNLPTETSPIFTEYAVSKNTVIRCATFRTGALPSEISTRTYLFETAPTLAVAFITADSNSLFDPDTGIYMEGPNASAEEPHFGANYWLDKTIPAEITFFEPGAAKPAFSKTVGFEIFGNYSRANDKKAFALKFRKQYGDSKLDYKVFPEFPNLTEFKDIVFRANGGNFYQDYIRDRLGSGITKGLGVDYQKARPSIVFINGNYFGIYNIRERLNEHYFTTNYGYDENSIDLLKTDNSVTAGSGVDYTQLEKFIEANDLTDSAVYAYVSSLMDIDNYISYIQTEMFIANRDWPGNNLKKWKSHSPETPWRWILYDLDWGFDNGHAESQYASMDMFSFTLDSTASGYPNGTEFTVPIRNLLKNSSFRNRFINRFVTLTQTKFSADTVLAKIRTLMNEIQAEIPRDQERWHLSSSHMDNQLNVIKEFAQKRPSEVISEMENYFGIESSANITLSANGCGIITVDGIRLYKATTLELYPNIPVTLSAEASSGCTFTGWSDGEASEFRTVLPANGNSYTANFR